MAWLIVWAWLGLRRDSCILAPAPPSRCPGGGHTVARPPQPRDGRAPAAPRPAAAHPARSLCAAWRPPRLRCGPRRCRRPSPRPSGPSAPGCRRPGRNCTGTESRELAHQGLWCSLGTREGTGRALPEVGAHTLVQRATVFQPGHVGRWLPVRLTVQPHLLPFQDTVLLGGARAPDLGGHCGRRRGEAGAVAGAGEGVGYGGRA